MKPELVKRQLDSFYLVSVFVTLCCGYLKIRQLTFLYNCPVDSIVKLLLV